jgi:subtilisin-like proprotein convertase family protein
VQNYRFGKCLFLAALAAALVLPVLAGHERAPLTTPSKHCGISPHAPPFSSLRERLTLDDVYASTDTVPIPDYPGDTAVSVIEIHDDVTIHDLNVFVDIHHTWMRDLRISLTMSDTTNEVVLLDLLPMDSVVNMRGWFDDDAGVSILQADTPLIGSWRPVQALSVFRDRSSAGQWTLHVYDRFPRDSGYIAGWKIDVNPVVNIQGVVKNSVTQAPVREAIVWAAEAGSGVRTGSSGSYAFSGLTAGTYTLLFTKADYETLTVPGVEVTGVEATTLDAVMQTLPGLWEFASTARAVAIPDVGDSAAMPLLVNQDVIISDLDVTMNIQHTWMGDLDVYLVSPSDTVVHLAPHGTGDSLNGYIDTRFDDEAALSITQGSYPFTGSYRPVGRLAVLDGKSTAGTWYLRAVDRDSGDVGTILDFTLLVVGEEQSVARRGAVVPGAFTFYGCSPNPFNSRTEFRFGLARPARVRLVVFDLLGREVSVVADGWFEAGSQRVPFDAAELSSGLYFARLTTEHAAQVRKIVLLK